MKPSRITRTVLVLLAATLLLLPFFAAAAPVTKEFRKEVASKPGALVVLENLAGKVTVEGKKEGPVDRHDVYRYAGEGSRNWGSTSTTYLGRKVKVVSGSSTRGVELWADFILRLPSQTGANLRNEVGSIAATNVDGPVTARSGFWSIRIAGK